MKKLDLSLISQSYKELYERYEKLGYNISQALELLLKENSIPYLSINYRTKDSDSFIGKIQRKSYQDPFSEIEDICGVRIICYYQSDIDKIKKIVRKEFNSTFDENKIENLDYDQFGYRSHHFVVKIKKNWLNAPNYRGLENLKAELQIRTVLMHAWAEIEHKSESQVPIEFRRKLSRISAKLEESDEQFEEIKNQIEINNSILIESAKEANAFSYNVEFNLDSLQAFLDYAFGNRGKNIKSTSKLFEEMKENNISLKVLTDGYEKVKDIYCEVEKEEANFFFESELKEGEFMWGQTGAARTVLELVDDNYYAFIQ